MEETKVVVEQHTMEQFSEAYFKLCREYGWAIRPELSWKPQIDGTFTVAVSLTVVPIKEGA